MLNQLVLPSFLYIVSYIFLIWKEPSYFYEFRVFEIAFGMEGIRNFAGEGDFLSVDGKLRSDFDNSNLFQS